MSVITYLNGRFLPASQAALPLSDTGFIWGATVTDRLRTFRQKLFRLDDHLRRFRASCERAFVPQPRTDTELAIIAQELVKANVKQLGPDDELSLVIFATPGSSADEPTLGMQATPLDFTKYAPLFREGATLVPIACVNLVDPAIKHRSRLAWWIAKERNPGSEPLFTAGEPHHFVRETPIANFLAAIDGELVSPPRSTILNGISLQVVEELCSNLGIPFREREIGLREILDKAQECLLASTSFCLAPVGRLVAAGSNSASFPDTRYPIPDTRAARATTFRRLLQAWSDLVGVDILYQFLGNP